MAKSNTERFMHLANYEIQNRAFALDYTKRSRENWGDEAVKQFWAKYYELEVINQRKYQGFAQQHQLDMTASTMTNMKTNGIRLVSRLAPDWTLSFIAEATQEYVLKLEELKQLGQADDSEFLAYVVEQEYVQIEALKLAANGQAQQATQVLANYIDKIQ